MRRNLTYSLIASALLLSLVAGCGVSSSDGNEKGETDAQSAMEVSFLELIGKQLVLGAAGELGGQGMGMILNLLIGGGGDDDQSELEDMHGKLDRIETVLNSLTVEVQDINSKLDISVDEIILNANDPYDAMKRITQAQTDFDNTIGDLNVSSLPKYEACSLANDLIGVSGYNVQDRVSDIYYAMLPSETGDTVKQSVITNYKNLNIEKKAGIFDGYYNLERYTTNLLYAQLRGLNLAVEGYNTPHTVANIDCNVTESGKALNYIENFEANKTASVWNPAVGHSFISNVWSYAMHYLSAADVENNNVETEISQVLRRAEFYRRMAVGDQNKTGSNLMLITTADWSFPHAPLTRLQPEGKYEPSVEDENYTTEYNVTGHPYPYWDEAREHMKMSREYRLLLYYFGERETGTYWFTDNLQLAGENNFTVQRYTPDYLLDEENGTVSFGMGVATEATNAKIQPEDHHWDMTKTHVSDEVDYKVIKVDSDSHSDVYTGKMEYAVHFVYDGEDGDELYLHYKLKTYSKVDVSPNAEYTAEAHTEIKIGLHDVSSGAEHYCTTHSLALQLYSHADAQESTKTLSSSDSQPCTVALKKGHSYSFFIEGYIHGNGNGGAGYADSEIKLYTPEVMRLAFE